MALRSAQSCADALLLPANLFGRVLHVLDNREGVARFESFLHGACFWHAGFLFRQGYEILWQISSARAECVSAPIEMASTPRAAYASTFDSEMPPLASISTCIPQILAAEHVENRADFSREPCCRASASTDIASDASSCKRRNVLRRRARRGFAAHFDFDERRFLAKLPRLFDRHRRGIFFAAGEQREMVVLDHDRVAEPEAMGSAVAEMQRALVEQPPGSFSRAHDSRRRALALRAFLQAARSRWRCRSFSAMRFKPTRSSESSLHLVAFGTQQHIAGPDRVAILLFKSDLDAMRLQQESKLRESRSHSAFAGQDHRLDAGRSFIPRALAVKSSRGQDRSGRGLL